MMERSRAEGMVNAASFKHREGSSQGKGDMSHTSQDRNQVQANSRKTGLLGATLHTRQDPVGVGVCRKSPGKMRSK